MPDKFLTSVITDLAKLSIRIDSMPHHPIRDSLQEEFDAKRIELVNATPAKLRHNIDHWIEAEINRQRLRKDNP